MHYPDVWVVFLLHSTNGNVSMLAFWKTGIQPDLWKMYLALRFAQSLEKKVAYPPSFKKKTMSISGTKIHTTSVSEHSG